MEANGIPRAPLEARRSLRVGLVRDIFDTVTRSKECFLNNFQLPASHIEPLFNTRHLEQLFRRVVFSVLTANTDDHLRNHGFLREGRAWILSPAYDLNPNPYSTGVQLTSPGIDDATASVELACSVAGYYRLTLDRAKGIVADIESSTAQWRAVAASLRASSSEIELWRRPTRVSRLSRLVVSSRPGLAARIGPALPNEPAMPVKDRRGRDKQRRPTLAGRDGRATQ